MNFSEFYNWFIASIHSTLFQEVLKYLIPLMPILTTVILALIFWDVWMRYIRAKFYNSLKYTVLEVKLPKDTFKSPKAMEVVLTAIHNTSNGSTFAQYWKGEYRPYYSLELISIEGQVKFMIWCEDRRKIGLISALYSQYPNIEIHEREDYTKSVHFDPKEMKIYAVEMKFNKEDPYPIKTYVDYGLDKDPKEEFKVDPLLPFLEWLGNVGPNQQVWIQLIVQAHIKEQVKSGHFFKKTDKWKDEAEKLKNEIMKRDKDTKVAGEVDENGKTNVVTLSEGEKEVVSALDRSVSKLPFRVGIRALYISPRKTFDTPFGIGGIISGFKQFNSEHLNGFKPDGDTLVAQFGDPWKDFRDIRRNYYSKVALAVYKRRAFFYPPYVGNSLILNTEELATIYHFPGSVAATPNLDRIPSKKSQAPVNLPI